MKSRHLDKSRVIMVGYRTGGSPERPTHVMIVRNSTPNSMYYFPGGAVEEDESFLDAAVREVHEELGIYLSKFDLIRLDKRMVERNIELEPEHRQKYREAYYLRSGINIDKINAFNADPEGEIYDYRWAGMNDAMIMLYPRYALMLDEILRDLFHM